MEKLEVFLKQFGLSAIEIKLYLTLLEKGPSTILELGKYTKINRTTTHINIENLLLKGLATYIKKGARRNIIAEPPEKFSAILEQEKLNIKRKENSMSEMIKAVYDSVSHVKENTQSEVKYYEGNMNINKIYDEVLQSKEIRGYGRLSEIVKIFPENTKKFIDATRRGVEIWDIFEPTFLIHNSPFLIDLHQTQNYHLKVFPEDSMLHSMDYLIYADSIAIIQDGEPPTCIVIKNRFLSDNSKIIYDLLWKSLPKVIH